jgi:hypothetical protein
MNDDAWARLCRKNRAIDDVKARYRTKFAELSEQLQAEIDEIERNARRADDAAMDRAFAKAA